MINAKKNFVQKRDNFRVSIPVHIFSQIELDKNKSFSIRLDNISLGGCKLIIKTSSIQHFINYYKLGTLVNLKMALLGFEADQIKSYVRNIKPDRTHNCVYLGLSFEKLKADESNELQSTIFKIDRELRNSA